jgi:hypothetical protein
VSARTRAGLDALFEWIAQSDLVPRDETYLKGVPRETRLELMDRKNCC